MPPVAAEGIRITPRSVAVSNDSLHMFLEMDLNAVHVNAITSVTFTPLLEKNGKQLLLPPVVVTGTKRQRFERRERALQAATRRSAEPYRVLVNNHGGGSKLVTYKVSVPFASWMVHASLLLKQELKDCCDLQLLGVDTLTRNIAVQNEPAPASLPAATPAKDTLRKATAAKKPQPVAPAKTKEPTVTILATAPENYEMTLSIQSPVSHNNEQHIRTALLYIDYPLGKDDVYPDYKNNRSEIAKIDTILQPLLADLSIRIRRIRVRGYASPDGDYRNNERLATSRSRLFSGYIRDAYGLPDRLFDVSSVAEDWKGLKELLNRMKPDYYREALSVIDRYGVFSGREKQLMDLQGGVPYRDMLKRLFPKLRRIEIVVEYDSLRE